ncbi:phage neck terminator protein [Burkholderia gladioli]|uniref:phage neck terminator protein n=1 Tax=Burkholderia gladioli TaxID=28095 RepID=UPI001640A118|nr:hypothetical protein [Burkholderia gladioli]
MNDSSTGGYLAPTVEAPPDEDDALDNLLHDLIAGVTALDGSLVRPRWQPTVPKQPAPNVNWCAFGVSDQEPDANPVIQHDGTGDGSDTYIRHEGIEVACTFYGPNAKGYAQRLADSLAIPQNREALGLNDMAFVGVSKILPAPDYVNQQWIRRYDITFTLRRKITRTYPVLNLLSVHATTTTDSSDPVTSTIDSNL